MKVLHLINTLSAGGAELHLLTLCRHLKNLGVETTVGYLKRGQGNRFLGPDFDAHGIRVTHLGGDQLWDGWHVHRAWWLVRQEKPDILHTHLPRADLVGALLKLVGVNIPWVMSVHAIYRKSWRGKWSLPILARFWRRADAIIAISHAVKNWLIQDCKISPGKIQVIHYGIDIDRFEFKPNKIAPHQQEIVIGSIGRLDPVKGHDTLIQAMPSVLQRYPQTRLLIAGPDVRNYRQTLQEIIIDNRLDGRVKLLGFVRDIPAFLDNVHIFAFASRSEGFGQVLIEAMAARKPVVATRIPPITEIVVDGETGLLVPPNDPHAFAQAILSLIDNRDRALQMGHRARQRVQQVFSAEAMTQKTMQVYMSVLNSRGRQSSAEFSKLGI